MFKGDEERCVGALGPPPKPKPPVYPDVSMLDWYFRVELFDPFLQTTTTTSEETAMSSDTTPAATGRPRTTKAAPAAVTPPRARDWVPSAALAAMRQAYQDGKALLPGIRTQGGATYRVGRMGGEDDLFSPKTRDGFLCWTFAMMASHQSAFFFVPTAHPGRAADFFAMCEDLGPLSAGRYEKDLRARFAANRWSFREGYSLPMPPTPELRYLYDAASRFEARAFPGRPRREDHDGTVGVHARAARDAARLRALHASRPQAVDVDAMTPEDQVRHEVKRLRPDGPGFSAPAGELHWGPWPLANAVIVLDRATRHVASRGGAPLPAPTGPASVCPHWRACAGGLPYLSAEAINGVDILFQTPSPKGK